MKLKHAMWDAIVHQWESCTACPIGAQAKKHVFGKGSLWAEVMFVGEGPGKLEDLEGVPFIGLAGQLLGDALKDAGGYGKRSLQFFYTNLVCCRPCDTLGGPNRPPSETEIANCSQRFKITLETVNPSAVVLLGRVPERALASQPYLRNYKVFCMEHPAYILRLGGKKSDKYKIYVQKLREVLKSAL